MKYYMWSADYLLGVELVNHFRKRQSKDSGRNLESLKERAGTT